MKVSAAVLVLLLIAASCSQTFSGPAGSDLSTCCSKYTGRKLPQNRVERYYLTSSSCPLPAVMFITKKGNSVCANPNDAWVQSYLQNLKQN